MFKQFVNNFLRRFGFVIQRTPSVIPLEAVLSRAKQNGLAPRTVIDVGATWGGWSRACSRVFPDARYVLIEPLVEYRGRLESVARLLRSPAGEATYIPTVVGANEGAVTFNVHPDLEGSSLLWEPEEPGVNGVPRQLPCTTLDTLRAAHRFEPPHLLKLDVQGAELEVLKGGLQTLAEADYVILEVSLFAAYHGAPSFHEAIAFMKQRGFVVYDVLGLLYRPLDGALAQMDVCFVKEESVFRQRQAYGQRA